MQLDFDQRVARLSVGEWARFSLGPTSRGERRPGRWRTEVGSQWHRTLQAQTEAQVAARPEKAEATFEVGLRGTFRVENWRVEVNGRLDQVITDSGSVTFREVKTIRQALPMAEDELLAAYPEYAAQLAIYLGLAQIVAPWCDRPVAGELYFVEIAEGLSQRLPLPPEEAATILAERKATLGSFLRAQSDAAQRRTELRFTPPFPTLRPGQAETREALTQLATRSPVLFFEAPTGYGKTGTVLEYALERLRDGLFDRVLYLTGKSTGQIQVARQLEAMLGKDAGVRFLQMRNRAEHALQDVPEDYFDRRNEATRWAESGLTPATLFAGPTLGLDAIKRLGRDHRIDPYAISLALLPHAEIWIGDYNYAFAPRVRQIFEEVPGHQPQRTLLIIDEAHNLADRVAGALSGQIDAADAHLVATQVQLRGWPDRVVRALANLAAFLDQLPKADVLEMEHVYEGQGLLREAVEPLLGLPLDWDVLDAFALDWLWELPAFLAAVERPALDYLAWSPKRGQWAQTCLDASPEIAPQLQSFGQCVLMSATLQPWEPVRRALGLGDNAAGKTPAPAFLEASAPWRKGAYRVAVDTSVDTRYQARERSIPKTAFTIAAAASSSERAIAAFFPSYAYARAVAASVHAQDPFLRVMIAPRSVDLAKQTQFVEEALLYAHAIFLVLGTGFTEGIDLLGGRISRAIVVGPALPEVNAVTRAGLEARALRGREVAFREVYLQPAMIKINQALGRLVRGPGQKAQVLLHGKRLALPEYQALLAPDFQTETILRTSEAITEWWASP